MLTMLALAQGAAGSEPQAAAGGLSAWGEPLEVAQGGPLQPGFDQWFEPDVLRLDYFHAGVSDLEDFSLDQVRREPHWAGNRVNLIDPFPYGRYRVVVRDAATGAVLYSRGFCTLFGEWQTTPEARTVRRTFHETLRAPWPKAPVKVELWSRDGRWVPHRVWEVAVDPASYLVSTRRVAEAWPVRELQVTGAPEHKVDLLILGDGYTAQQMPKLERDARRFMEVLFSWEPFKARRQDFNLRVVLAPSREVGPDEPRKGLYRDSRLGFTFNTFETERYLNSLDNRALQDVAANAPRDALLVLVNASRYGGAGLYNFYAAFVSDNEYDDYVAVHEFGHAFAALGDEYFTSQVAYSDFYPRGVEPWEPNITALLDPPRVKWAPLLTPGVPVPTPADQAAWASALGVFEGAGYAARGLYRPSRDCKMFSKGAVDFCGVCRGAIEAMIDYYVK
jgi:hypothetical protein